MASVIVPGPFFNPKGNDTGFIYRDNFSFKEAG
jgi:hypothetical protein